MKTTKEIEADIGSLTIIDDIYPATKVLGVLDDIGLLKDNRKENKLLKMLAEKIKEISKS